ncbi:MAG: RagB/SusD family nutrient uptake outer membrane protein [Rikenellaceae bacterium]
MKNIFQNLIVRVVSLVAILSFTSCEDYFQTPIAENITNDTIYSSMYNAERGLNAAYYAVPYNWAWGSTGTIEDGIRARAKLTFDPIATICDEAVSGSTWSGATKAYYGTTSVIPGNVGLYNSTWRQLIEHLYEEPYFYLRYAYLFLESVDSVPDATPQWLAEKKGEAKILIAICWYELIKRYGSVPYVDGAMSTNDITETCNDRPALKTLINNVDALLADAILTAPDRIDESSEDFGRVTKATAYFLRSRLWLLAASPLFNTDQPYCSVGLVERNEVCLENAVGSADWRAVWEKAAQYSLDAINYCEANGYSMNDVTTGNSTDFETTEYSNSDNEVIRAYRKIFQGVKNNREIIQFSRRVATLNGGSGNGQFVGRNLPPIATGGNWGATAFTQPNHAFIQSMFRTTQGEQFDYSGAGDPWVDADYRFKANLVYDGCSWGEYTTMSDHSKCNIAGTGYFMRKFMYDEWQSGGGSYAVDMPYYYMRLPELYFNYAEALCELDYSSNRTTIETYINKTTQRMGAGAATISLTGLNYEGVRDEIRREKAVEFIFEDQRYFDVKRWKIADTTIGSLKTIIERNDALNVACNATNRTYFETKDNETMVNSRQTIWEDKMYLMPFPQYEIDLNMGLNQNPGY